MSEGIFAATRLTVARQRRMLTKKALAESIDVSPAAITQFEKGSRSPSSETSTALAAALGFPVDFFYGDEVDLVQPGLSSFRALRAMSARIRDRVRATGALASSVISPYLANKFVLPDIQVPAPADEISDPAIVASEIRDEWHLGQAPIDNVIHLLESKGIQVYWTHETSMRTAVMDALSFWHDGLPFIIMNSDGCGERQRFSVVHELGHLVLHRGRMMLDDSAENEASEFAANLLLPETAFREWFPVRPSMADLFDALFTAKQEWRVSMAAAMRRASELDLISENMYAEGCRELSIRGWRKVEPGQLPTEASLLHEKIFTMLAETGMRPSDFARELSLGLDDVLELMPVGKRFAQGEDGPESGRPRLHLLS